MASGNARGQGCPDPEAQHTVDQPLTFKTLTILALLYRTWAAARLEDLGHWAQSWPTPDMFAVMEGTDAAMGAFRSAVVRECATLQGALLSVR